MPPPVHDSGITDSPTLGKGPAPAAHAAVHRKPVNFSRRSAPTTVHRDDQQHHDVRAIQAYYEPDSVLPSPPAASAYLSQELAWDGQRGEMVSRCKAPQKVEDQRHPGLRSRSTSESSDSSNSSGDDETILQLGSAASAKPSMPIKSILKKTEVEQYSEHAGSEAGESMRSRHTPSDNSSGTWDTHGNWHASDADTSCLSEEKVKKLEKKGIDPSLYVEMKQAKGKSVVGVLTGTSFVG